VLLLRNELYNPVVPPLLGGDDIENTASSIVALDHVYRAVAWQRVDQIRYNIRIHTHTHTPRRLAKAGTRFIWERLDRISVGSPVLMTEVIFVFLRPFRKMLGYNSSYVTTARFLILST
jgi:hypothetical protein